ncbi:MAG: glycoside hydrolase family 127 protein [Armatimonadota bacterium]
MPAKTVVIGSEKTPFRPVPIKAVHMRDGFWKTKMDLNHTQGLPVLFRHLEEHGIVDNFRLVSGRKKGQRRGPCFTDSDLFKWMEGAAWDLVSYDDSDARALLESVIDEVVAAQQPDGYLNTFFQGELAGQRFRNLDHEHELYCAGHMIQAAVAHYRVTGSDRFLGAAIRYVDYLVSEFGSGKREKADGHPEIEMALIELYRTTGKKSYLDLAEFFLSFFGLPSSRDICAMNANGQMPWMRHAVRALYLSCGAVDYFAESGDARYEEAVRSLWRDLTSSKMYVTGGVGSRYQYEAIGDPYELPNERAYAETCAAVANTMFNYRLVHAFGDACFADEMERALYNGVISGVGLDGKTYFYVNPLACFGEHRRQEWYSTTCCPTNMVRLLASMPGYLYSVGEREVRVNLFASSRVEHQTLDGTLFKLDLSTDYPWDGNVDIRLEVPEPLDLTLSVRIPWWCRGLAVAVNGQEMQVDVVPGNYLQIKRIWQSGDQVHLNLGMPVLLVEADPRVREDLCSVAVQRGPLVYCAESVDNSDVSIRDLELASGDFQVGRSESLGGVVVLRGRGLTPELPEDRGPLYRPRGSREYAMREAEIVLVPYYAWANRGVSHMAVWLPFRIKKD